MEGFGRVMELLAALQTAPSRTGEELADRLGVTLRTVRRDIVRLRDAGFRVDATPGVYGGYRLGAGTRMPPLVLTDDEAIAVAIALRGTATATVGGLEDASARDALAKLEQLLPLGLRSRVADLRSATISLLRTPPAPADARTLTLLARACRERVTVTFAYTDGAGRTTEREAEPYRLVQTSHCWYLVARDAGDDTWRTFRADRITAPVPTRTRFRLDDPPDAERLVTEGMAVSPYSFRATLRLPVPACEALDVIPRSYGVVDPIDDDTSEVTIGFEDRRWLIHFITDLPWDVEVLDPPSIRTALADLGRRLAAKHGMKRPSTRARSGGGHV